MQADGTDVTARELYNRFFNIGPHKKVERMIIATFQEHNQECRATKKHSNSHYNAILALF